MAVCLMVDTHAGLLAPPQYLRFDLAFTLLDRPDEVLDQALSEHVMALHSGEGCGRLEAG